MSLFFMKPQDLHVLLAKTPKSQRKEFEVSKLLLIIICIIVALLSFIFILPDQYERNKQLLVIRDIPPSPNIWKSPDYIDWVNNILAEGRNEEFKSIYDNFWNSDKCKSMISPDSSVKLAMEKIIHDAEVWDAGNYEEVNNYLNEIDSCLQTFCLASRAKDYVLQNERIYQDTVFMSDTKIPNYRLGKYAVLALLAEARKNNFNRELLLKSWRCGLCFSNHMMCSKNLMMMKLGMDISNIVASDIQRLSSAKKEDHNLFTQAALILKENFVGPDIQDIRQAVVCEWAIALSRIQELYPLGRLDFENAQKWASLDLDRLRQSKLSHTVIFCQIDDYYSNLVLAIDASSGTNELLIKIDSVEQKYAFLHDHPIPFLFVKLSLVFHEVFDTIDFRNEVLNELEKYCSCQPNVMPLLSG